MLPASALLTFLINVIVVLAVAGVLLWALPRLPLDGTIKSIIKTVIIVVVAIWLILVLAGLLGAPILR